MISKLTASPRLVRAAAAATLMGLIVPLPAAAEITSAGVVKGIEKVSNAGFENFGTYAIRIEELGTGRDGEYQALLTVRNKGAREAGLVASHIRMTLISAENEPRINFGDLYQPDVVSPTGALTKFENTIVLQPGEQTRIRLTFVGSKGFAPKKVRLREYVDAEATVTYTIS